MSGGGRATAAGVSHPCPVARKEREGRGGEGGGRGGRGGTDGKGKEGEKVSHNCHPSRKSEGRKLKYA